MWITNHISCPIKTAEIEAMYEKIYEKVWHSYMDWSIYIVSPLMI